MAYYKYQRLVVENAMDKGFHCSAAEIVLLYSTSTSIPAARNALPPPPDTRGSVSHATTFATPAAARLQNKAVRP